MGKYIALDWNTERLSSEAQLRIIWRLEKLRRSTISFVVPACPSAWRNAQPTGRIFMKFDIWALLEKSFEKFKFH